MTKIILSNGTGYLTDFPADDILKGMRNNDFIFVADAGRDIAIRVRDVSALEETTDAIIQPSERVRTRIDDLKEKYPNVKFWCGYSVEDENPTDYPMVCAYTLGYVSDCAYHCGDEICCSGTQRTRCWNRLTSDTVRTCEPSEEEDTK